MLELNRYYNMDCMEGMKQFPDKYFDLAIVDPPYGIGMDNAFWDKKKSNVKWDVIPTKKYFNELRRVSKNQIIWGVNYFDGMGLAGGRIIWNKLGTHIGRHSQAKTLSDCEIAFSSFHKNVKMFSYAYMGNVQGNNYCIMVGTLKKPKIHPTQKPIELYTWLLNNYAKQGDKILDTHVGSASSLIACHKLGFEYVGFELNKDYWEASSKRLENEKRQISIFELVAME